MANPNHENATWGLKGTAIFLVGTACLIAGLYFSGPRSSDSRLVGQVAPPIEYSLNGQKASLANHVDKVVLLNFWASWCAPCVEEMSSLRALEKVLQDKPFVLLAFNIDETHPPKIPPNNEDSFPDNLIYTFDRGFLSPFRISAIPLSVIIDKKGLVREVISGPRRWDAPSVIRELSIYF